jgi:hypothetical protein
MQHALKFVTEVRSDSEYADIPEQAIFEIDAASAAGIAALSRKVLDADANKIEVFDYRTTWLKKSAQSDADIEDPENQEAVELDALVVSGAEFWFAGYLKHTTVKICTERQRIDEVCQHFGIDAIETVEDRALAWLCSVADLKLWDWSDDQGNPLNECAPPSDGYEDSHNALMALIDAARTFLASIGHESTPQGPGRIENPVLSVATASMQSIH